MKQSNVELLRHLFPAGCRVVCDYMDDFQAVPSGSTGTVIWVDDGGTIHVKWDNARSSLGLIYGVDQFRRIA